MTNDSERASSPPNSISGDVIILFVFLLIGGIMFAVYVMGLSSPGEGSPTNTATLTRPVVTSKPAMTLTPTPSVSSTVTALPTEPASPTLTRLAPGAPTLTPGRIIYPTATTRPKTTAVKSSTPVRTNTPVSTITHTPTRTVIVTSTITTTITPVNNDCATTDPGLGLPVVGDTWIESAGPTINHGSDTLLLLRADNNGDRRILLKFDLASFSGLSIASAKLYFYINSTNINSTSGATIYLYNAARYWEGIEATWRLAEVGTAWTNEGGDYNVVPIISIVVPKGTADCRVQLDLTALVRDWSTGSINNGVILIATGTSGEISISSSRATPIANPLVLLVVMATPTVTTTSTSTTTLTSTSTGTPTVTATVTNTPTPTP
jgi:hypothetical protein